MKVRLIWWDDINFNEEYSLVGCISGFRELGCEVDLVYRRNLKKEHFEGVDFIITPCLELAEYDSETPIIFQIEDYVPGYLHPSGYVWFNLEKVTEKGPVIVVDPSLYYILYANNPNWDFSRVFLVPNGVEIADRKKEDDGVFTILYPQGTSLWKDPDTTMYGLVKFLEKVPKGVRIIVVVDDFKGVWKFLGYRNISFMTPVPYDRMRQFYSISDVVVSFSAAEVFLNTMMEAAAFGIPSIVRDLGFLQTVDYRDLDKVRELVFSLEPIEEIYRKIESFYHRGFHYLKTSNEVDLAGLLKFLYESPGERSVIGTEAKNFAERWFSWKERAELIKKLYSEMIL